jgi:hypothetical protein
MEVTVPSWKSLLSTDSVELICSCICSHLRTQADLFRNAYMRLLIALGTCSSAHRDVDVPLRKWLALSLDTSIVFVLY